MRLSNTKRNLVDITVCIAAAMAGVWVAYYVSYFFPPLIYPAIAIICYCCYRVSVNVATAIWLLSLSFSKAEKNAFFLGKSKATVLITILLCCSLFSCLLLYGAARDKFENKELLLYGKQTTATVYDYHYARRNRKTRYTDYYYKHGDRNYQGYFKNKVLQVGDTLSVIYSTHIPEINRVIE